MAWTWITDDWALNEEIGVHNGIRNFVCQSIKVKIASIAFFAGAKDVDFAIYKIQTFYWIRLGDIAAHAWEAGRTCGATIKRSPLRLDAAAVIDDSTARDAPERIASGPGSGTVWIGNDVQRVAVG